MIHKRLHPSRFLYVSKDWQGLYRFSEIIWAPRILALLTNPHHLLHPFLSLKKYTHSLMYNTRWMKIKKFVEVHHFSHFHAYVGLHMYVWEGERGVLHSGPSETGTTCRPSHLHLPGKCFDHWAISQALGYLFLMCKWHLRVKYTKVTFLKNHNPLPLPERIGWILKLTSASVSIFITVHSAGTSMTKEMSANF